jgi:hypothetical protein
MHKFALLTSNSLLTVVSLLTISSPALSEGPIPGTYVKRINDIADFKQNNPKANFAEGGKDFCAPTSLSDHLMWLANHGYPDLKPKGEDAEAAQIELIKSLASDEYMGTDPSIGTSPAQIMKGLKSYVAHCGYQVKSLKYQGFRPSPEEFSTGISTPELDWLKAGSIAPKSCWLNIGWYDWDEKTDTYTRVGGHWVALVGYGVNAKGESSPATIIVHDPMPRFGTEKANIYIELQKLSSGKIEGKYKGLPHDATGFYWYENYTNGEKVKTLNRYGLIDGGIVLELSQSAK